MERDLARIPAVSSARVVIEDDDLREVHIVCAPGRSPKLIGRDVQSLLAAQWGVDIDHRKISVVQLEDAAASDGVDDGRPAEAPAPRRPPPPVPTSAPIRIATLAVTVTGHEAEASVILDAGGEHATGRARGVPSWAGQRRLAAAAALDALGSVDERLAGYAVGEVASVRMGSEDVIVVTVVGWSADVEVNVAGAAPIGPAGELRAAADAVLRAFPNRR